MSRYRAPWCTTLKVVSFGSAGILLSVALLPPPVPLWARAAPLLILAGSLPFLIRGYVIGDGALLIRRLWWNTRLDLAELKAADVDPHALRCSIRVCGNGGLFSFTGWFWNRRLKTFRAFLTDPKRSVVLTFRSKTVIVSPDDPDAFVRELAVSITK